MSDLTERLRDAKNTVDDGYPYYGVPEAIGDAISRIERLEAALRKLLERYVSLVNSGDCGTWDSDGDDDVIAARAALEEE